MNYYQLVFCCVFLSVRGMVSELDVRLTTLLENSLVRGDVLTRSAWYQQTLQGFIENPATVVSFGDPEVIQPTFEMVRKAILDYADDEQKRGRDFVKARQRVLRLLSPDQRVSAARKEAAAALLVKINELTSN